MRRDSTFGLTLVEWILVLVFIGIILGLLFPAVRSPRRTGGKAECANNLRQLALATMQFEQRTNQYPGFMNHFGTFAGGTQNLLSSDTDVVRTEHEKIGTWAVEILADLDWQPVYEIWTRDEYSLLTAIPEFQTSDGYDLRTVPNLEIFQCPNDFNNSSEPYGKNSYVSNNGFVGIDDATGIDQSPSNGVFNLKVVPSDFDATLPSTWADASPRGSAVRSENLTDGAETTMLFSENLQAKEWYRVTLGNTLAGQFLSRPANHLRPAEAKLLTGMVFFDAGKGSPIEPTNRMKINGGDTVVEEISDAFPSLSAMAVYARPSSAHNGGVNASFADGSVRFISEDVDYLVYVALMTPVGAESSHSNTKYVLLPDSF